MMHYETLPNGKRAQVRDGYTMRNGYFERDGHGGHGIEHRKEMASIALQIMQDNLPRMVESICLDIDEGDYVKEGWLQIDISICMEYRRSF